LNPPSFQIRDLIQKYDQGKKDEKISFKEFIMMYKDLLSEKGRYRKQFLQTLQTNTTIETKGGSSAASVEGTTHNVKAGERNSFTEWINKKLIDDADCKKYLPMVVDSDDLFKRVKDGILLCKLINDSVPDTIDERTINKSEKELSMFKMVENLNLALMSAQSIGCNIINIGPDDIMAGKPHLILGLLWQVIRIGLLNDINLQNHPRLMILLKDGEELDALKKLSPEQILIRWVNYHLQRAGVDLQIKNFTDDITDSAAYSYLLEQIAPADKGVSSGPALGEQDLTRRAGIMLGEADKIGCNSFVTASDVVKGHSRLNLAFVANLFNNYPALEEPEQTFEIVEETREEKTYRNWMNSLLANSFVHHLFSDLHDGCVFLKLYDIIKPGTVDWKRAKLTFKKLHETYEKIENCNYCVELGKDKMRFSLVSTCGKDIHEGNETLILGLVWQLMRAYTLSLLQQLADSKDADAAKGTNPKADDAFILNWARDKLKEGGKTTTVSGFNDQTLSTGRTIIDLIDCIKKGVVNYSLVKEGDSPEEKESNAKYAVSSARKIGAKVYALPEDVTDVKPKMIMTIFACLMIRDLRAQQKSLEA